MGEGGISDDNLHGYKQILNLFSKISNLISTSIDLKNKDEVKSSYQALHISTLILRDLLNDMHGINGKDIICLEERAQEIFDRNREELRKNGQWTM